MILYVNKRMILVINRAGARPAVWSRWAKTTFAKAAP